MEEDEALEDGAIEQEPLADSEVMEDDEEAADEDNAGDTASDGDTPPAAEVSVTAEFSQDELLALVPDVTVFPIEAATCVDQFAASKAEVEARVGPIDQAGQTIEFFPVLIDGEPNEFVVVTSADGVRSGVLFSPDCTIVDP